MPKKKKRRSRGFEATGPVTEPRINMVLLSTTDPAVRRQALRSYLVDDLGVSPQRIFPGGDPDIDAFLKRLDAAGLNRDELARELKRQARKTGKATTAGLFPEAESPLTMEQQEAYRGARKASRAGALQIGRATKSARAAGRVANAMRGRDFSMAAAESENWLRTVFAGDPDVEKWVAKWNGPGRKYLRTLNREIGLLTADKFPGASEGLMLKTRQQYVETAHWMLAEQIVGKDKVKAALAANPMLRTAASAARESIPRETAGRLGKAVETGVATTKAEAGRLSNTFLAALRNPQSFLRKWGLPIAATAGAFSLANAAARRAQIPEMAEGFREQMGPVSLDDSLRQLVMAMEARAADQEAQEAPGPDILSMLAGGAVSTPVPGSQHYGTPPAGRAQPAPDPWAAGVLGAENY